MGTELEQDGYVFPGKRIAKNGSRIGEGQGMTLRDWFAGQALAGLCNNTSGGGGDAQWYEQIGAPYAYRIADAMIAARDQSND